MRDWLLAVLLGCGATLARAEALWWTGFIDANDKAFAELPHDKAGCAERARAVGAARAEAGSVVVGRASPARELPPGARLTFTVADLSGGVSERVLTRTVAIAREDESLRLPLPAPCWYLAEAGTELAGYRVAEDRLAIAVHPPRPLVVRAQEDSWRTYGDVAYRPGADARFQPGGDLPPWVRERLLPRLPGARQFHVQPFTARLARSAEPERLWLIGAIAQPDGDPAQPTTYDTLNLIVHDPGGKDGELLFQAGPSGGLGAGRAAGFAAQVVTAVDLDGDGIDELILRARYYSGGNLKVLRWNGMRYQLIRDSGYEGE